ncbi:MAG: CBS domain-containing protein [Hyphomicrobiales bacterium]
MNVAGILRDKGEDIVTMNPDESLRETVQTLASQNIGAVVVTDDRDRVCGIISERDIVRAIAENGDRALEAAVKSFMTKNVVTCSKQDTVAELMTRMTEGRFRHLPVLEGERLVGIISIGDVVKQRIAEQEMEVEAMRGYIASG